MPEFRSLLVIPVAMSVGAAAAAQQFIPIEPLPGDTRISRVSVSGDGSVVAGTSIGDASFTDRAFIWTPDGGYVELEPLGPDGTWARAEAISADGTVVVGMSNPTGASCGQPVRWVNGGPPEHLNPEPEVSGFGCAGVFAASGDGTVLAGEGDFSSQFGLVLGSLRWTPTTGMVHLGFLDSPLDFESLATAVSDDGSTIVGGAEGDMPFQAYRWTKEDGVQGLGWLPGAAEFSVATDLSADGSVIGGQSSRVGGGWDAVYWVNGEIFAIPSIIPSADIANAVVGVSGDGTVMVGYNTGTSPSANERFIWDATNGPRNLQTALENEFNVDFNGWILDGQGGSVGGISSDGNAIIGIARNPDTLQNWGWIVYLESEPKCAPADLDCSGSVGVPDLLILLSEWGACKDCGDCSADLTGDCNVGVADLLELLASWG